MTLEPFNEFRRLLSPYLREVAIADRKLALSTIYRLAKRKSAFERRKGNYEMNAKKARASRLAHGRVRVHLQNALKSLAKARAAADDPELLNNLDMVTVETLIREAVADINVFENHFLPAETHPELRIGPEKVTDFQFHSRDFSDLPGFGIANIDYWFIGEVDKYLETCVAKNGKNLTPDNISQIIAKSFEAAFSQAGYKVSRVKTARRRIRERREISSDTEVQN